MTLTVLLSPQAEARLREKAAASGQALDAYAAQVLEEAAAASTTSQTDHATINMLRSWNAEDATNDSAEIAARERDWEEFAASINAHHSSNRKIYP